MWRQNQVLVPIWLCSSGPLWPDFKSLLFECVSNPEKSCMFFQLYLTGAVYSLDGSNSLKETMQVSIAAGTQVRAACIVCFCHVTFVGTCFHNNVRFCHRAQKRWTSRSSEWESRPTRSRVASRTRPRSSASTWPTYCSAKEPRRSWRWPGSSMTPDRSSWLTGGSRACRQSQPELHLMLICWLFAAWGQDLWSGL